MIMQTSFFFLSFILFAFSTNPFPVALAADLVLDINGDELMTSESYYALPHLWGFGGGLTIASNINGSICPFSVIQSPSEVDHGQALSFSPILDTFKVIPLSTPLDIEFSIEATICLQSTVWTVDGSFITTNGVKGSNTRNFRIEKIRDAPLGPTYKFVYCSRRRINCQDIGRTIVNGVRPLTIEAEAFEMVFVKVEDPQIKRITNA